MIDRIKISVRNIDWVTANAVLAIVEDGQKVFVGHKLVLLYNNKQKMVTF